MSELPSGKHLLVAGLGFGDEGKGVVVDYLTSINGFRLAKDRPKWVVRYNGGAQAGHRVVTNDGRQHTFSQFGSGYFNGAMTFLSRFMLVNPLALIGEAERIDRMSMPNPLQRTVRIDRHALITTPLHIEANRAREEARGKMRHGSVGMGIGETVAFSLKHPEDAPTVGDTQDKKTMRRKLYALHDYYIDEFPELAVPSIDAIASVYSDFASIARIVDEYFLPSILKDGTAVFEGAQGVLLDQDWGFHPYTTWSKTTFENALTLLREAGQEDNVVKYGVARTYMTRHGSGPFPTEDGLLSVRADQNNVTGPWQGSFRFGHLDSVLLDYAAKVVGGIDGVFVTNIDRTPDDLKVAVSYDDGETAWTSIFDERGGRERQIELTALLERVTPMYLDCANPVDVISQAVRAPVVRVSFGPQARHKAAPEHLSEVRRLTPVSNPAIVYS